MSKIFAPNYTQIPNVLLDGMVEFEDSELRVLLAVCRQTFGWQREAAVLSKDCLAKSTGLSAPSVLSAVQTLIETGWLEKLKEAGPRGANAFKLLVSDLVNHLPSRAPDLVNHLPSDGLPLGKPFTRSTGHHIGTKKEVLKKEREAGASHLLPSEAIFWNENCGTLPKVLSFGASRLKHLKARRGDSFWVANFEAAVEKIVASKFCCGESERGWLATFDWLVERPDALTKVMEGKYDSNGKPHRGVATEEEHASGF